LRHVLRLNLNRGQQLDVQILGSLQVAVGDRALTRGEPEVVPVTGRQLKELLVLLVLRAGSIVSNDELIDAIWRGAPTPSAPTALRGQVKVLRDLLEPNREARSPARVVLARNPGYVLAIERHQLDAHRFEDGVTEARRVLAAGDLAGAAETLRTALDLWRGPALEGLDDLPPAQPPAQRWNELRTVAQTTLAEIELDRGHHAELVPELQELVTAEPLCERFTELLMQALYRCGRQGDALRVMARTREHLLDELGVDPGEGLVRMEQAVLEHDPWLLESLVAPAAVVGGEAAGAGGAAAGAAGPSWGLPRAVLADSHELIARTDELEACLDAWRGVLGGDTSLLVVEGEPGAGKSRLLSELARDVGERGATVLHGRCYEDLRVPFQPFASAMADHLERVPSQAAARLRAVAGPQLARIVPDRTAPAPPPVPPADDARENAELERWKVLDAATSFLAAIAAEYPTLLVIDDLQWADAPSLLLLGHLLGNLTNRPVLLAASCRDDALTPTSPLSRTLLDAKRTGVLRRLPLRGLGVDAVCLLLHEMVPNLEAATAERLGRKLHQLSEGNPFFARELIAHLRDSAMLDDIASGALAVEAAGLPVEVQVLLGRRMGVLRADTLDLLRSAAVVGSEVDLDLLGEVTGRARAELTTVVDEAYEAGLVIEVPGTPDSFTFNHELLRHTLYGDLPPGRRARLHRRVGEVVESRSQGRLVAHSDLARHFSRAGSDAAAKALAYCEQAGTEAYAAVAYEDAVSHFEEALRVTARSGAGEETRARLLVALGRARTAAADPVGARRAYMQAADMAAAVGRADLLADAALGFGSEWSSLGEQDDVVVALLDRALAAVDEDQPALRSRLLGRLAMANFHRHGSDRAAPQSRAALAAARAAGDPDTLSLARHVEHEIHWAEYGAEERLAIALDVVALAGEARDPRRALTGRADVIADLLELGRVGDAEAARQDYEAEALRIRRPVNMWWARVLQSSMAGLCGPLGKADELAGMTFEVGIDLRVDDAVRIYAVQLFTVRWLQGRLAELADLFDDEIVASAGGDRNVWLLPKAMVQVAAGDDAAARATFAEAIGGGFDDVAPDTTWIGRLSVACELAWHFGDDRVAAALLVTLLPFRGRGIVVGTGAALFGPLDRALALAAASCGQLDLALELSGEAVTMCRSMGARPWLARACTDRARILRLAGHGDAEVDALEHEARVLAAEVGVPGAMIG
jgi:DNA-binding SARP family transcriptional activator/tetratricopeptide (TPR) repeat protein